MRSADFRSEARDLSSRTSSSSRDASARPGVGVERRPGGQEPPRGGGVGERLGDVPVLLAAGDPQQRLREVAQDRLQRFAEGLLLGEDARCVANRDARSQLTAQALQPGKIPVEDAPAGDDVGRIGLDFGDP
jgi:hypothetical protein